VIRGSSLFMSATERFQIEAGVTHDRIQRIVGRIELDDESGLLHGDVLNIRDVITFQGRSVGELENAFRVSIEDYLAFCNERGESPDRPSLSQ
jgi:predicted HicB family RNase H-like nuclease